jgi:hypothetical protein
MTLQEWIIDRSSSEAEKNAALESAANFLDETVVDEGTSGNSAYAIIDPGVTYELVLDGEFHSKLREQVNLD